MSVWDELKYFKPHGTVDNWGNPEKMDPTLLRELDAYREYLGHSVIVTSGCGGTHVKNSFHYKGLAVDTIVPVHTINVFDLFLTAMRFSFRGIGIYGYWTYNQEAFGGLHLDMRPIEEWPQRAMWVSIYEGNTQVYLPLRAGTLYQANII